MLDAAAATDAGIRRSLNEDHYVVEKALGLFVVCDGMGGHAGGEVASRLACEALVGFVRGTREGAIPTLPFAPDARLPPEGARLAMALRVANREVWHVSTTNAALAGMGATAACVLLHEGFAHVAHVGDSRVYRFRGERLEPLTRDHSGQNELVDLGLASQEQAALAADKHVITRALGSEPDVEPTSRTERLKDGDVFLLCSDGLTDLVSDRKIQETLVEHHDLKKLCAELVRLANKSGGKDNITVVAVRYAS